MIKAIKDFAKDCARAGSFYAHHTTPKFLHPISIPVLAITVAPVMKAVIAINDYRYERDINRKVAKHQNVGEFENKLRDIFGETSINGYTGNDIDIAMQFNDSSVIAVFPDHKYVELGELYCVGYGENREIAAEDLIGKIAADLAQNDQVVNDDPKRYEHFFKVQSAPDLPAQFFTAAQIHSLEQGAALDFVITASHQDYDEERKYYAVMPVDAETNARLQTLETH